MEPYYEDAAVTLYCGDMREVLPALDVQADAIVADPPYGKETSHDWDRWIDGWPTLVSKCANSMWCFGSSKMFGEHWGEFEEQWTYSHDIMWSKPRSAQFTKDRFRRSHEPAYHWYHGPWNQVYTNPQRVAYTGPDSRHGYRGRQPEHTGTINQRSWVDDGTRLMLSVIEAPTMWRRGQIHSTEKSPEILTPLLSYAVPEGGLVLDPSAGSCSTLATARALGMRAIGIERDEAMCEEAVRYRLARNLAPRPVPRAAAEHKKNSEFDLFGGAA